MTSETNRLDRLLFLPTAERSVDDPAGLLGALGILVLCHSSVETWFWVFELDRAPVGVLAAAVAHTAFLALGLLSGLRRAALGLAAVALLVQVLWTFPYVANHTYLRLLVLGLLTLPRPGSLPERRLVHAALGWIAVMVLFYTGFQKLLYGTYFQGQYLAYMVSLTERFSRVFETLIPAAELARLKAIGTPLPGAGPYHVAAPLFVALSNLVYLVEIALAAGLLWRRTRAISVGCTVTLIALIELGAREVFFGLMFCSLILVLDPRDALRRLTPVFIAIYVLVLALKVFGWQGLVS